MTQQEHYDCSLDRPEVRAVLERLHMKAKYDIRGLFKNYVLFAADKLLRRSLSVEKMAWRMRDVYISVAPEQGIFSLPHCKIHPRQEDRRVRNIVWHFHDLPGCGSAGQWRWACYQFGNRGREGH